MDRTVVAAEMDLGQMLRGQALSKDCQRMLFSDIIARILE
jgi:hypothetical protein